MSTVKTSPFVKLLAFPAARPAWDLLLTLHAALGTAGVIVLAIFGLYALYVIKMKLGIDIIPAWGLHLPGPRTLLREIGQSLAGC
jgi:hypothetical protein